MIELAGKTKAAIGIALVTCLFTVPATAAPDLDTLGKSIVHVEVNGKPLTGFIWQRRDQVVTALHGLSPGAQIWVTCDTARHRAKVERIHLDADLALLSVQPFPQKCLPIETVSTEKPASLAKLYSIGYHASANAATSKTFEKAYVQPPETLSRILGSTDGVVAQLKRRQSPSVSIDIYHVQGGLLPGMSGAPAVNDNGQVIGVVNGGLKSGMSGYNWTIPSKHIHELMRSGQTESDIPTVSADSLFSYGAAEGEQDVVLEYEQDGYQYTWVKTRTMSLEEVMSISDTLDLASIRQMLYDYRDIFGADAESRMQFDIYEEINDDLIIAVPVGQKLNYDDSDPGFEWLESYAEPDGFNGHIDFNQVDWAPRPPTPQAPVFGDAPAPQSQMSDILTPADPGYFNAVIRDILNECNEPPVASCQMVQGSRQDISYWDGSKVMTVSFILDEPGQPRLYEFYTYAVRGDEDVAFRIYGSFNKGQNDMYTCMANANQPGCTNSRAAFTNLQQILAVMLSTTRRDMQPQAPMDLEAF